MKRAGMMALAVLAAGQVWAAAFDGSRVSAGATWVVHADLVALRALPLGQFVVNKLGSGDSGKKLAAFTAIFGCDPLKDLRTLDLYGKSRDPAQSVFLAEGTFDGGRLVTLLQANDTYQSQAFGAYTIHSWVDEKKPAEGRQYGCLHPSGTLLISRGRAMLEEALDVLDGKRPALDTAKAFGAELLAAPLFMAGANVTAAGDLNPGAAILKQAASAQVALAGQGGELTVRTRLTAKDGQAASNMLAVAQGLLVVAQLGQEKHPELARCAQAVQVRLDDTLLRLDLAYPETRAIVLVEECLNAGARPAADAPAPEP